MIQDELFEFTPGHMLRQLGNRALAAAGNKRGQARHDLGLIINKLYNGFVYFCEIQGLRGTADDLNAYIQRYFPQELGQMQQTFPKVLGASTTTATTQPQAAAPAPAPTANSAAPAPSAAAPIAQPTQAAPVDAHAVYTQFVRSRNTINRLFAQPTVNPQQVMLMLNRLIKSNSNKGDKARWWVEQYIAQLKHTPMAVQKVPELTDVPDDPFQSAETGETASQPEVGEVSSPDTGADETAGGTWRPVRPGEVMPPGRRFRMDMSTGQNMVWEPDAPKPETPKPTTDLGANVHATLAQINSELRKPNPDKRQIFTLINNALHNAPRGTQGYRQASAMLQALANNPQVVARVPELARYRTQAAEAIQTTGSVLTEAAQRLNRAVLYDIFVALARSLAASGKARVVQRGQQQQRTNGYRPSVGGSGFGAAAKVSGVTISPAGLNSGFAKFNVDPVDQNAVRHTVAALQQSNTPTTLTNIMQQLTHLQNGGSVMQALLYATERA